MNKHYLLQSIITIDKQGIAVSMVSLSLPLEYLIATNFALSL